MADRDAPRADDSIVATAADWVARIEGGAMTAGDRAALADWLDASREHTRVFHRMSGVMRRTDLLRAAAPESATPPAAPARRAPPLRAWLAGSLAAGVAALALFMTIGDGDYLSGVGEALDVNLADGSRVHLNAASGLRVAFDDDERRVELRAGEALFDVARDLDRPFVVVAGDVEIRVVGTAFNVSRWEDRVDVAVARGAVEVSANAGQGGQAAVAALGAGDALRYDGQGLGSVTRIDRRQVAAWRDGWLIHERRPLGELVARLNRQFPGQIDVADAALAATDVNVVLQLGARRETLDRLEQVLPVRIEHRGTERATIHTRE